MHGALDEIRGCGIERTTHSVLRGSSPRSGQGRRFLVEKPVNFHLFDAEYVRRLRAGEPAVQEHFSLYFQEKLQIKLRRYDFALRADIIQDTFLRALEKLRDDNLRQPESLGAFVFGICKNVCYERIRKTNTEMLSEEIVQTLKSTDNPERDVLQSELRTALRRSIGQMADKERRLLIDFFFKERTKADICKEFGVTPGYLRVCLHRAKKALKRRFLQKFDERYKSEFDEKD
jgi:RNA polymerase sigma-70 factor, ECF subfamily